MVSLQAFTTYYDLTTTYDIADYKSINYLNKAPKDSMMSVLYEKGYSYFADLINTAELQDFFGNEQANFTLFVVKDDSIPEHLKKLLINADKNTALSIINYNTLKQFTGMKSLHSAACYYVDTRYNKDRLLIENTPRGTFIDQTSKILEVVHNLNNGIIYVVDKLLIPYYLC